MWPYALMLLRWIMLVIQYRLANRSRSKWHCMTYNFFLECIFGTEKHCRKGCVIFFVVLNYFDCRRAHLVQVVPDLIVYHLSSFTVMESNLQKIMRNYFQHAVQQSYVPVMLLALYFKHSIHTIII